MSKFISFFLGTPKRFVWTVGAIAVALAIANPDTVTNALRTVSGPLLGMGLTLWILSKGLQMIVGGPGGKKK